MSNKLGILAGGGSLPRLIIDACQYEQRDVFVLAFRGQADSNVTDGVPHSWVNLGAAGKSLRLLKEASVSELVLAGNIVRPTMASLKPDAKALKFFMKLGRKSLGDDGILRALIKTLESEGFKVTSPTAVLRGLQVTDGVLGAIVPDEDARSDIARGIEVLRALSPVDVGQAIIVQEGLVLGIEAAEGTDSLIERCGFLKREGPGPILIKLRKMGQETRVDLPTIGPDTVKNAIDFGLRGLAIEANATLIIERAKVIKIANEEGLFVIAITVKS